MSDMSKISIQVGEFEFEYEGSQIEVDEKFAQFKEEGFWNIMTEMLQEAKDINLDTNAVVSKEQAVSDRGLKFRNLVENCSLEGKPDRVLGALHLVDHYHATPHERKLGFTHRECLVSGGHTAGGREHPDTKERRACWAITRTSV